MYMYLDLSGCFFFSFERVCWYSRFFFSPLSQTSRSTPSFCFSLCTPGDVHALRQISYRYRYMSILYKERYWLSVYEGKLRVSCSCLLVLFSSSLLCLFFYSFSFSLCCFFSLFVEVDEETASEYFRYGFDTSASACQSASLDFGCCRHEVKKQKNTTDTSQRLRQ